jgi:hypothetical protein
MMTCIRGRNASRVFPESIVQIIFFKEDTWTKKLAG